jgi:hypothetical protein
MGDEALTVFLEAIAAPPNFLPSPGREMRYAATGATAQPSSRMAVEDVAERTP